MDNAYETLIGLMKKKSSMTDPEQFHRIVNVIFHDHESRFYDSIHDEMWKSLPQQLDLIVDDVWATAKNYNDARLLDVGCGTGLASHLILKTKLGNRINDIHLLDTSSGMLLKAKKRAETWNKNFKLIQGEIAVIKDQYDLILISSVLHHIPETANFLKAITHIQKPGGLLITVHDPAMDSLNSNIYKSRCKQYTDYRKSIAKRPAILSRVKNKIKKVINPINYIKQINHKLLRDQVINEPLTEVELWSVTDIHVEGLTYAVGKGISKQLMKDALQQYSLAGYRTYDFFGTSNSKLEALYKDYENELIAKKDGHGRNFSSVWIKKSY